MFDRTVARLRDIAEALENIRQLLDEKLYADIENDAFCKAAFERFLEIISEASRHVPQAMQELAPDIEWARLRGLGNVLRHAYNRVDPQLLWGFHENGQLSRLQDAVTMLIALAESSPQNSSTQP